MRVLALAPLPVEAAATRFRLVQLQPALERRGIHVTLRPFLDAATYATLYDRRQLTRTALGLIRATAKRVTERSQDHNFDCVLVLREAMLFGPPLVEQRASRGERPLVLDLDDATYVAYNSPTYGRFARWLKWPTKTDVLIDRAVRVTAGNKAVADYVIARGTPTTIVPTVVDLDRWVPRRDARDTHDTRDGAPVIGWIGSHSTYPYLKAIAPALTELAASHTFTLRIIGAREDPRADFPGVDVDSRPWQLDTEVRDFQELDVGLYPLPQYDPWASGKSGLKAVQYMAVGIPFVVSPVGAAEHIGQPDQTHLPATTTDEWRQALATLLDDAALRKEMGEHGRAHAQAHYTLDHAAGPLADALTQAGAR